MRLRLPLSVQVPLAMGVSALAAAGAALLLGSLASDEFAWAQAEEISAARLSRQQEVLESALRRGDVPLADELVTGLRTDATVRWAALVDGEGRITSSTRRADLGRPALEVGVAPATLEAARAYRRPTHQRHEPEQLLRGAISLVSGEPTLREAPPGAVLVTDHDTTPALARIRRGVRIGAASFAGLLLLSVAFVGVVLPPGGVESGAARARRGRAHRRRRLRRAHRAERA